MSFIRRPKPRNESTRWDDQPSSRENYRSGASEGGQGEASKTATATPGSSSSSTPSSATRQGKVAPIVIDSQGHAHSVAFLPDGKHIVARSDGTRIRRWRTDDGREVGTFLNTESKFNKIAISYDGRWIVGETGNGFVEVWNVETNEKMRSWRAHNDSVLVIDVSRDGTKIVSGAEDKTICIWSRSTGELLLGPLQHDDWTYGVHGAKFSPDARLIATTTWTRELVRIYNSQDGSLLAVVPVGVSSGANSSLAWTGDGRQLFVLSVDGLIHCIDTSSGKTLTKWPIHSNLGKCIALANDGAFIAAASWSTVSLWDVSSQIQVGSVLQFTHHIDSMAISDNLHLAVSGEKRITLRSLRDMSYNINDDLNNLEEFLAQLSKTQQARQQSDDLIRSMRAYKAMSNARITRLEKANRDLNSELSESRRVANDQRNSSNAQIQDLFHQRNTYRHKRDQANLLLRAQEENSKKEVIRLEQDNQQLRISLAESQHTAKEEQDRLNEVVRSLQWDLHIQETKSNEQNQRLCAQLQNLDQIIRTHEQKHQCETLYAQGHMSDAVESFLYVNRTVGEDVKANHTLIDWFTEFPQRCIKALEEIGDNAMTTEKLDDAIAAYAASLSLNPSSPSAVLTKWARTILAGRSARNVLNAAAKLDLPKSIVYQAVCVILEEDGRLTEAVECFHQIINEFPGHTGYDEQNGWEHEFRGRCAEKLVKLGDTASKDERREDAIEYYSGAISLQPADLNEILLKRSNQLIELDPSSHKGYEDKHAALNGMRRYGEALAAFQLMLSKIEQSPNPEIQKLRQQYLDVTPLVHQVVQQVITPMPRLLIDTETGRLYNKSQQAAVFKELPIYDELRSSITKRTQLNLTRIQDEVKNFYRYVMFSHRWEVNGEPVLQDVQNSTIYVLEATSPNIKLQSLCKIVRKLGFKWVWSDTCCIDKKDNVVLQESLVAMFAWYRGSALTLVHLRGVWSHSQKPGHLRRSIWNSRVWTYQEYLAAEVVQFYTEDWKPYLDLDVFNHKESPVIIEEMEPVSGISSRELAVLRPGLDRVREKLSLASTRETTLQEDIAYSLLGIFHASIPVIYGEGDRALGRLLEYVLTGSGDVSILAWTGHAGGYNSCLPVNLGVYDRVIPPHIPPPIEMREMDGIVTRLRSSSQFNDTLLGTLYHRLRYLPKLRMAASRLELSGIVFHIPKLVCASESDPDPKSKVGVYRATTFTLGDIEIRTADDLSGMTDLVLFHPWIRHLLHQEFVGGAAALGKTTQALRLLARLQQPFGALLFQQLTLVEYKRIAADSLIMVQIREEVSLTDLIDDVTTIEVQ